MIVTRTPFRITLGGGGTDLPSFYSQHGGFIFAMGIDKYMYIMLNPPTIDSKIRLHYSRSEIVDDVDELQHELAREALRLHGVRNKMEISSMADLPDGTGLGSSSSYLVGLLTALHHHRRDFISLQALAEEACHIELDVLGKPIGKQDQYMAAFGGLTVLEIARDGTVAVRPSTSSGSAITAFVANTHLYYTGHRRSAVDMLSEQDGAMRSVAGGPAADGAPSGQSGAGRVVPDALLRIKDLGYRILDAVENEDFDGWGMLLHEHWCSKKRLSAKVSLGRVDALYEHVRAEYGVLGGKIVGAGGGGFVMLYCPGRHRELERFMLQQGMPRLHYAVEYEGARVMANLRTMPTPPAASSTAASSAEAAMPAAVAGAVVPLQAGR
jgi:D-glycero-alpha-D-manno-heptose-7-phosphate kinase